MKIDGRLIGADHPPYIIAELSANHNGSLERALQTIDAAKHCGADAIKLQTYTADTMTIDSDAEDFHIRGGPWDGYTLYKLYQWAQTPFEWHRAMFDHARRIGITVFSTPFDESAVDLLEDLGAPAYKIASFENTDLPLIRYAARTGKPMIISTGLATPAEVSDAVLAARDAGCRELSLLHCVSSYPSPSADANVRQVAELARVHSVVPGLSDHTHGVATSLAAVALGACIIEKHFTLSRADKGPDSAFSLEPDELRRLVTESRDAWLSLGAKEFVRPAIEEGSRVFRRSIYFVRDLPAGAAVTADDIRRIRPGMGLAPKHYDALIGRRLKAPVTRGTATRWELFEEDAPRTTG